MTVRLLLVSHTHVVPHHRAFTRALRSLLESRGGQLQVLVPAAIDEPWGRLRPELDAQEQAYCRTWPAWPRGRPTLRAYLPGWDRGARAFAPTHVHVEEEPYSLAALQVSGLAARLGASFSFYSSQNLERTLPPPLRLAEAIVSWRARRALASCAAAAERLARRLPACGVTVIPQYGVDLPPAIREQGPDGRLRCLYAGRLVAEKGVLDLVEAVLARPQLEATFLGAGPLAARLQAAAAGCPRIRLLPAVEHAAVAAVMLDHDVLVLPSLATPRWQEQFGRVLVEAMACGLVPVGSGAGATPEVIDQPDLVFPAGDAGALGGLLEALAASSQRRRRLGAAFRRRAQERYTHERVALAQLDAIGAGAATPGRRLLLVADSPAERWPSMDRHARELGTALSRELAHGLAGWEVQVAQPPGPPPATRTGRLLRVLFDRYWLLPRAVRRSGADVVHVLDHSYGHLLGKARAGRAVATCHDLIPLDRRRAGAAGILYRRAVAGLAGAERVLADSASTRARLLEAVPIDPARVEVLPLGVGPAFFAAAWCGIGAAPVRLLHVGLNSQSKRVPLLLGVAAELRARGLEVEVWKVGEPLGSGARDLGWVPEADLPGVYARATMLVFPSAAEGFGWPVAEAMACGLPVVASDIPVLRELTGDHAVHVQGDDPAAYADAIESLLARPAHMRALSRRGRQRAAQLTWEHHTARLSTIYKEVASQTPPPLAGGG